MVTSAWNLSSMIIKNTCIDSNKLILIEPIDRQISFSQVYSSIIVLFVNDQNHTHSTLVLGVLELGKVRATHWVRGDIWKSPTLHVKEPKDAWIDHITT